MSILKNLQTWIIDLLFPAYCLICEAEGVYICSQCAAKLKRVEKQKCLVCQKPSAFGRTHTECSNKNKIDGIVSALTYHSTGVKNIIETFKYKFVSSLANELALLISTEIRNLELIEYFKEFTILPVPLHLARLRWRGFNQSELLAQILCKALEIKYDATLIARIKNTKPQVQLTKEQRKQNIQNAFRSTKRAPVKCLIIDDVVTTGSTLNEIARILKKNGAKEVWAITVAAD